MSYTHRRDPAVKPEPGQVRWHYSDTNSGASFAIAVLRHGPEGTTPYCVCAIDTRSNPQAELDADRICASLESLSAQVGAQ